MRIAKAVFFAGQVAIHVRLDRRLLAGVVGFEPTVHATKKRCLTAWLHPISGAVLVRSPLGRKGFWAVFFDNATRPTSGKLRRVHTDRK
jgi:hypothetical protein